MPIPNRQSARRWPTITFALIAINLVVFLVTHSELKRQLSQVAEAKRHLIVLAALHPGLDMPAEARTFVYRFSAQNPEIWKNLQSGGRLSSDEWEENIAHVANEATLQDEMDSLAEQYLALHATAFSENYTFQPSDPTIASFLTANFLHVSWLALAINCVFLALAGFVAEQVWGRLMYAAFVLLSGALTLQVHAWAHPGRIEPAMGASGVAAALVGVLVVGVPVMKLERTWFKVGAFSLAPLWVVAEFVLVRRFGELSHWMLAGGLVFGIVAAIAVHYAGAEVKLGQRVKKEEPQAEAALLDAEQFMDEGDMETAERLVKDALEKNPKSVDALEVLRQVYWRQNDIPVFQETTLRLCEAHMKAHDQASAWRLYEDYLNSGAPDPAAPLWLELCRVAEEQQLFERAIAECEKLAAVYPGTREAVMAQLRAARIYLKQLLKPELALDLYEAAYASPVPHLDLEQMIQTGLRESKAAMAVAGTFRTNA